MNGKITTRDTAYMGLFTALIAISAWISIPVEIPFTLQTLGIMLTVGLLGTKRGTLCVIAYITLGALGLPVFAGFSGGMGVVMGTTGGYIIGFILFALVMGLMIDRFGRGSGAMALAMLSGTAVCYFFGTLWFYLLYTGANGYTSLLTILGWCVFPFVLPDCVKIIAALLLIKRLEKNLTLR